MNCVYKFQCLDKNIKEFYIGSSVDYVSRMYDHKCHYHSTKYPYFNNLKLYKFIRNNGGWDNWQSIIVEKYENYTKQQLLVEEQKYKDLLKPQLNSINAYGRDKEKNQILIDKHSLNRKNIKDKCPHCHLEMLKCNIARHVKFTCRKVIR